MADELDEGFADEKTVAALGGNQVEEGEEWKQEADEDTGEELPPPVPTSPARKLVVPPRCEQLLTVGLSHKL